MSKETPREAAYSTITEPMTVQDAAREMGVTTRFVGQQIQSGRLKASPDGKVTGNELAAYLAAHRRD